MQSVIISKKHMKLTHLITTKLHITLPSSIPTFSSRGGVIRRTVVADAERSTLLIVNKKEKYNYKTFTKLS